MPNLLSFKGGGGGFVDRGDPPGFDFLVGDFIQDGALHDIDLSSIIPKGAKAALLRLAFKAPTAGSVMGIRKKGLLNWVNMNWNHIQVPNVRNQYLSIIQLLPDRKIEYILPGPPFTEIYLGVGGWWF